MRRQDVSRPFQILYENLKKGREPQLARHEVRCGLFHTSATLRITRTGRTVSSGSCRCLSWIHRWSARSMYDLLRCTPRLKMVRCAETVHHRHAVSRAIGHGRRSPDRLRPVTIGTKLAIDLETLGVWTTSQECSRRPP